MFSVNCSATWTGRLREGPHTGPPAVAAIPRTTYNRTVAPARTVTRKLNRRVSVPFPHSIQHNCIFSLNHIFFFTFNFGNEYVRVHTCYDVCTSEGNLWEAVLSVHHVYAF